MSERTITIGEHLIDPDSVQLLPQLFCYSSSTVILGHVDPASLKPITVGLVNPDNVHTLDTIAQRFSPRRIVAIRMSAEDVTRALNAAFGMAPISVAQPQDDVTHHAEEEPQGARNPETVSVGPAAEHPPDDYQRPQDTDTDSLLDSRRRSVSPVDLVNRLLLESINRAATDIHLENERREVTVRIKLDGLLYKIKTPINKENVEEVINRLKVMSNLDISEHRAPQDGRILLRTIRAGQDYDVPFRISILPGPHGEEVVLRVLDKSMAPVNLELLGFTSRDLKTFRQMIHNPQGMILVTGPTGSGKTTTLYATLKEVNTRHNKVLSAEDPIEYSLDGVNQKQISPKFGFADMARAFLRHDPDIILIGEIRDNDTADVACKAAQTGHLILSTLHTNDSVSSISRLHVLGLDYDLIASSVLGVLSQRLVRRVCENCKTTYRPEAEMMEPFKEHLRQEVFYRGGGCERCNDTGYHGRIGVFELFVVDHEIQRMIFDQKNLDDILTASLRKGMTPLIMDGLRKVAQAYTTVEELHRVIPMRQIIMQLGTFMKVKRDLESAGGEVREAGVQN